jgi:signal transduction histidine kinase
MHSSALADSRILKRQAMWTSDFQSLPSPTQDEMERLDADVCRWREVTGRVYRAWLAVPLVLRDEVYGSLAFYYSTAHQFTEEEIDLAKTFADQAALAIENATLRHQAEENAAIAERSRLARDLHDAVTQTLFAASLIAEVLPRLWERDPDQGKKRLDELRELTRGALAEMRTLLLELRPTALKEANLDELFRHLRDAFTGRTRIPARLVVDGEPGELPPEVKITLYRITQEALNNTLKHARANQVDIILHHKSGGIELQIQDDGRGFDLARVPSDHLGLGIMRERAANIGAILQIDSIPGRGTCITASWSSTSSSSIPDRTAGDTPPRTTLS